MGTKVKTIIHVKLGFAPDILKEVREGAIDSPKFIGKDQDGVTVTNFLEESIDYKKTWGWNEDEVKELVGTTIKFGGDDAEIIDAMIDKENPQLILVALGVDEKCGTAKLFNRICSEISDDEFSIGG